MRKVFPFIILFFIMACSDDDTIFENESDLVGTWLLIEQYADPGDGSGEFRRIDSDRIIQFSSDGTYTSNGSFCNMSSESDMDVSGTYQINDEDLSKYSAENYLIPENCSYEDGRVFIHFEGSSLVLSYLCFEGCGQKYRKR